MKLKRHYEELAPNTIVIVTFTIGCYRLQPHKTPEDASSELDTSVSFNVKHVIILGTIEGDFVNRPPPERDPWGLKRQRLPPPPHVQLPGTSEDTKTDGDEVQF